MTLLQYQLERIGAVRSWYDDVYRPLDGHAPESIRYMALWAVLNALYNIADYPNVKLRRVNNDNGIIKPYIRGRGEEDKLRFIARQLAQDDQFSAAIVHHHLDFIVHLAQRTPEVQQPPNTRVVEFVFDGNSFLLDLSQLHGLASLDNRVFLDNQTVLFQYHHLELDLDGNNLPRDRNKFFRQLIFMLYQLRNNIVHGGSAAFFMKKTQLSVGAIRLLNDIVHQLLDHPSLLEQDDR